MGIFEILWKYKDAFLNGFVVTIELVSLTCILGTIFGILFEFICRFTNSFIRRIVDLIAFSLLATPALVLLFWLYYPAQTIFDISLSPFTTALFALVLINSFSVYRITADAIHDFPKQYISSAIVCGMKRWEIVRFIQAPLIFRAIIPRWIDQQVVILQTSVFASLISVEEIFRVSQRINSVVYEPVIIYTSMAVIFLTTAGIAILIANYLRKKYSRDFSER